MTLRKSLFWSFGQQFGMMGLQLVNMIVIARLLTPDEIGVFVIALAIVTIIQALREMGLSSYLIRAPHLKDEIIRATFGMSIALCAALGLGLFALRHQLESWIGTPGLATALLPIVAVILIFPIEQPAMAIIRREMRFDVLARASITAKFWGVVTSIGLAMTGMGTMALVWGLLVDAVLRVILMARLESRHLKLGPSITGWRPLIGFGAWTSGASLAGQATQEGNKLLLGGFLGAGPTAYFDRAVRIPGMVRMGLFMPLGRVLMSSFSEDLRQGRDIGPKVERLTSVTTGMVWPCFIVLAILSEEIIRIVLGPQWGLSARIMPWLLLAQGMLSLLPQPEQILVPYGKVRRLFALRMFQMTQSLSISYIFLVYVSVPGVNPVEVFAWGRPVNTLLFTFFIWLALRHGMNVPIMNILRGHLKSAAMALATAAPVAAWKFGGLGDGSIAVLILLLGLAAILGFGTGFLLRHPLVLELKGGVHWVSKRRTARQSSGTT